MASKGQVTIPKRIRDALPLKAGSRVEFAVNASGELVLQLARDAARKDCFDSVSGSADIRWRTDDLMKLLSTDD